MSRGNNNVEIIASLGLTREVADKLMVPRNGLIKIP